MQTATIVLSNATLGGAPERKTSRSGVDMVTFSAAINTRQGGDEYVTWYRVTCFGRLAESVAGLRLDKGSRVDVVGRFGARPFTGNDGAERLSMDLTANDVIALGDRNGADKGNMESVPW